MIVVGRFVLPVEVETPADWCATLIDGKRFVFEPTPDKASLLNAAPDLLAACQEQHKAIDTLMAMLIARTSEDGLDKMFMPSKSGQPWAACLMGNAAISKAEGRS